MSVPTKTRRTKRSKPKERFIPWREVYKKEIGRYSEGGLMLRGSRHKAEMTQQELASALGVNQHHISEMENGKRPIGKEMAKRLAQVFKTDYRIFL
jgi:plasmid maintenance system antidote protein VapI